MTVADLWADAGLAGHEQTYTCVPPGSGARVAIDRDEDGYRDGDEVAAGTSPVDPLSYPGGASMVTIPTKLLSFKDGTAVQQAKRRKFRFEAATTGANGTHHIVPPPPGSAGDPTLVGATVRVYNAADSGEEVAVTLAPSGWTATGNGYRFRSAGPVMLVKLKLGRLSIKAAKAAWGYTLDEPEQRRMAVRLTLGSSVQWCAEAPARSTPSGQLDQTDSFQGEPNAPPPDECPAPPAG